MQSPIVLLVVALAATGLLPPPVLSQTSLTSALSQYTASQINDAVNAMSAGTSNGQNGFLAAIAQGITITTGPLGINDISLGLITLPPGYLCSETSASNAALNLTLLTSCYVCSVDCTWVHNKYGGFCGLQSNPASNQYQNGSVCVCGDVAPSDGHVKTPYEQCGPIVPTSPQAVNDIIGIFIKYVLLGREYLQCVPTLNLNLSGESLVTYNSAVCQVDCQTNHQYSCGICDQETPIPMNAGQTNTGTKAYCGCYYGQPTGANGSQCASS